MKSTCEVVRDYWIKKSIQHRELYDFQNVADSDDAYYQICLQKQHQDTKTDTNMKPLTTEEINQKMDAMIQERKRQDAEFKKRYLLNK
jgi:hypothetical protein